MPITSQTNIKMKRLLLILFLLNVIILVNITPVITEATPTTAPTTNTATATTTLADADKTVTNEEQIGEFLGLDKTKASQVIVKSATLSRKNGLTTIKLNADGYIKVKGADSKEYIFSNLKSLDRMVINGNEVKSDAPEIVFDSAGEIIEAKFKTSQAGDYKFGNTKVPLPSNANIYYKQGKAHIGLLENTKISPTARLEPNKEGIQVEYKTSENGVLELFNGYKLKGATIIYDNDRLAFIGKNVEINGEIIAKDADVITYLDFNGETNKDYKGAYISMNKAKNKIVIGSNVNNPSPAVMFLQGSPYGINIENNDHFSLRAKGDIRGSYFLIEDRSKSGKSPYIETLNGWEINQDGGGFYYDTASDRIYLRTAAKGSVIKSFGENFANTGTVPMAIRSYKGDYNQKTVIKDKWLVISNSNEYGYGQNPNYIRINYYKQYPKLFTGVSEFLFYNYALTKESFEKWSGISLVIEDDAAKQWISKPENVRFLYDVMESVPGQQMKMLKNIYLRDSFTWCHAYAEPGEIHMSVYDNLDADTMRHEMAHIVDFKDGRGSFRREWNGKGLNSGPHTWSYGYTSMEDISTFLGTFAYGDDETMREYLGKNNQYYKKWRARVIVAYDNYFFTKKRMQEIFSAAGLQFDENSLNKYRNMGDV
ncbi:MAG: hypothetical protein Q8N99_07970 [Nanoarchaeota archaeon]|nr:hypothetical protein [Nanoarchaeota archaeon]